MPYRNQQLINNGIYHTVLRAVDDNLIFKNIDDYYRGIFSIYEFNNAKSVEILKRRQEIQVAKKKFGGGPPSEIRERLVDVLAFCFMPNHLHLLLKQIKDNGITKFMSKVGTGYGGYFNRKYKRKGYVFQNRFSVIRIANEDQFKNVFVYIHTNPVALTEPRWKEKGIRSPEKIIRFLENYKWSSYQDYIGKKNFPSVTNRDPAWRIMGGQVGCKKFVDSWVKYKGKIRKSAELASLE